MKKSFSLLITIVLISLFSYLSISILQTKSFTNKNLENQFLYIQAKNHKNFLEDYIKQIKDEELQGINHLDISNEHFKIEAFIENKNSNFIIEIFIKSKKYDISIYEKYLR